jgi:hypothetical protein
MFLKFLKNTKLTKDYLPLYTPDSNEILYVDSPLSPVGRKRVHFGQIADLYVFEA